VQILGIRVVSVSGALPEEPISARFGQAEGDIGRGIDCTLVLADPERRISRRQAVIFQRDGRHFIRQIGVNLSVELDGVKLALEREYPLDDGAQLRVGPYLLLAESLVAPETLPPFDDVRNVVANMLASVIKSRQHSRPSGFGGVTQSPPLAAEPQPAPTSVGEVDLLIGDSVGSAVPQAAKPAAEPGLAEAFTALYRGLGIAEPPNRSAEGLALVGRLLREAVQGTLTLLATRAIAKRELGASATLAQTRENNPLKFSPDADAALKHLLGPARQGFIAPAAAMADAFDDLRAHEVAVLAGMRRALDEILARFDPEALEQRLAPKGRFENLMPGNRDARLWASFVAQHAEILREAEGDFDSLFGRAFREAYEQQLQELARASPRDAAES
jgi:predicted component of type VI protein secretion system